MLSFTGSLKVYVAVGNCDMRKSFEGLAALAMLTDGVELRGARLRPWYERD